ncbi:hypothetical protein [Nonomuraea sp. KM90]|uniref:hypothetical protein n=1 Tax=Nonomuraea sp. KM90 TaxID=3457428 RepID=UPI003FCD814B
MVRRKGAYRRLAGGAGLHTGGVLRVGDGAELDGWDQLDAVLARLPETPGSSMAGG